MTRVLIDSAASAAEVGAKEQFSRSFVVVMSLRCCLLRRKAVEATGSGHYSR